MHPARDEVVWSLIVPSSAAMAGERHVVRMSLPACRPWPRGSPQSSKYFAAPTTGKIIGFLPFPGGSLGLFTASDADTTARLSARKRERRRAPRAVVR